ncbi:hypothetical protein BDY17DRAFT_311469 [Neohortaea acidophila]|uniref:Uncharacterized protein n=1 Tax=Neohortaea acidophila TaxID=245834 RepID=A0A6A6PP26_9PEZI|nr:uncharacterized protein BDY17DRAFT_311469 [Neohortaea acidophila]KAF2481829.1 hypothetical protein BDY17DRAFT_311469 [Neohortaea acidophila]
MATYNPPAFPRRPKHSSVFSELRYSWELHYYRYQINTALYVMSPGEKLAYNLIVLSAVVFFLTAIVYYLPSAVYVSMERLAYYLTGSRKMHVAAIHGAAKAMEQKSLAGVATLIDGRGMGLNNASWEFVL